MQSGVCWVVDQFRQWMLRTTGIVIDFRGVRVFEDVDLSNVSSRRQSAGIDAHGFIRGRVTTSVARRRNAKPVATLARGGDGRVADSGAGAGYGYHLRRRIHSNRGAEGDGRELNEDWIAYRDDHGMVTLPVVAFSTCCPMNVPAIRPLPGSFELMTDTV